jgi:hypothetical protein
MSASQKALQHSSGCLKARSRPAAYGSCTTVPYRALAFILPEAYRKQPAPNSIAVENRRSPISTRTIRHVGFRPVTGTQIAKSRPQVRRRALACSARSPARYCATIGKRRDCFCVTLGAPRIPPREVEQRGCSRSPMPGSTVSPTPMPITTRTGVVACRPVDRSCG